jgi:hypothetical protein
LNTKSRREGYLLIDNRHAPGPDGTTFMEAATITCSHCQQQLIRNPARTRDREWCSNCDKYICDRCSAVRAIAGCKTFAQFMDEQDKLYLATNGRGF